MKLFLTAEAQSLLRLSYEGRGTRRDGPGNSRAKRQFITAGGRSKNGRGQVRGGQSGALQRSELLGWKFWRPQGPPHMVLKFYGLNEAAKGLAALPKVKIDGSQIGPLGTTAPTKPKVRAENSHFWPLETFPRPSSSPRPARMNFRLRGGIHQKWPTEFNFSTVDEAA